MLIRLQIFLVENGMRSISIFPLGYSVLVYWSVKYTYLLRLEQVIRNVRLLVDPGHHGCALPENHRCPSGGAPGEILLGEPNDLR